MSEPNAGSPAPPERPPRVLIVDDDPSVSGLLAMVFSGQACEVREAATAEDALELLTQFPPDAVFCDIVMPGMNGLQFIDRLQSLAPDVPAVLISGSLNVEALMHAVQLGAFDVLTKPVGVDVLELSLRKAIKQRRLLIQRRQREEGTARLEALSRRINVAATLDELHASIAEQLPGALAVKRFSLFLYDEARRTLSLAVSNHVAGPLELAVDELQSPMRDAVLTRSPVVVPDFGHSVYAHGRAARGKYDQPTSASIPLVFRGRLLGVLSVNDRTDGRSAFDSADAAFLAIAAEHLASALAVRQESKRLATALQTLEQAQSTLLRSERLAAVSKLLAGVAHELKNPLTSLQFGITNIEEQLVHFEKGKGDLSRVRRFFELVRADIARLIERINSFVLVAKPVDAPNAPCRIDAVAREVLESVRARCEALQIAVDAQWSGDETTVVVDPHGLRQAITNVVVNAVEAMNGRGRLSVGTERDGRRVMLWVEDTGPGISPEVQARMFDLFFTTKDRGSGIGLSQVHVFCETHGGKVTWRTGSLGTRFQLELPAAGAAR